MIRGRLSQWDCRLINDYRQCRRRVTEVFNIVRQYMGNPAMEYCIYYGHKMIGHAPKRRDAVHLRNNFYKNPNMLM